MNPLLKNNGQAPDPQQMRAELQKAVDQVKSNPSAFLAKLGKNVPAGLNDSGAIINHLMQSGQVTRSRYGQVLNQLMPGMRR